MSINYSLTTVLECRTMLQNIWEINLHLKPFVLISNAMGSARNVAH